jgi:hypothetical protein
MMNMKRVQKKLEGRTTVEAAKLVTRRRFLGVAALSTGSALLDGSPAAPSLSKVSASAIEDAEKPVVVLRNRFVEVAISKQTGAIVSALRRDERASTEHRGACPLLTDCFDKYELTGDNETVTGDEREDQVASTVHDSRFTVSFVCRNPALERVGISLTKRYTLDEGDEAVTREVAFHHRNSAPQPLASGYFVEAWANVSLEPAFRTGGYYYVPFGHSLPRLPAERVNADTPLYSSIYLLLNTAAAAFVHPSCNLTAASFIVATNGRYASWGLSSNTPEEVPRFNPVATATGWRHYAHRDYLKPGEKSSYSVRYSLLRGDSTVLLRQYLGDRERKRLASPHPVPAWMKDVKLMMFLTQADHFDDERIALWKDLAGRLGRGTIMPIFDRWGHASGDYPVADEETERLRRMVERLHREIPTAKVGTYVCFVIGEKTKTYQQHPDWTVRDRQGKSPVWDFPGRYFPQFKREDARVHYRKGISSVVQKLGLDYLYVDGPDGSAFEPADWGNREVGHLADRYHLMRDLVDELKACPEQSLGGKGRTPMREVGVFFNQPDSLLADAGFQEMGGGPWSDEGDWRSVSDACYFAKLATRYRPGTWVSHLYPYDLRKYFSMMLALALRPNFAPVNREQLDEFLTKWLPYVNVAHEIKDAHLLDSPLSPNWRLETTDWDAFALGQGSTLLLTAINHGMNAAQQTISVDLSDTPLTARPLFVWRFAMTDPTQRRADEPAVKAVSFSMIEEPTARLQADVQGERNLTQIVAVSAIPAWVTSVEGYPAQLRLTEMMGTSVSGCLEHGRIRLRVVAENPSEVEIFHPRSWKGVKVEVDGKTAPFRNVERVGQRFVVVPIDAGLHLVGLGEESA